MPSYDPSVIIRAYRFIAEVAGYRIVRGDYMDQPNNRADRYYNVSLDADHAEETFVKGRSPGYRTLKLAADAARNGQA